MNKKLTNEQKEEFLNELLTSGWQYSENPDSIKKVFMFENFIKAFSWMVRKELRQYHRLVRLNL